jgi:hypothetical protein
MLAQLHTVLRTPFLLISPQKLFAALFQHHMQPLMTEPDDECEKHNTVLIFFKTEWVQIVV